MGVFVIRRLSILLLILMVSTIIMFFLVSNAGDPYFDLRTDNSPNRAAKFAARTELLHLDQPLPTRYLIWLRGAAKCVVPGMGCDLGRSTRGQEVSTLLVQAMSSTLRLVTVAAVVALVLGIVVGVVSALRQYSGFDYTITFGAFLFFSLPIFWVAVLLKQYLAIEANNWLADPRIGLIASILLSLLSAITWGALLGGDQRRKWIVRGIAFVVTLGVLQYLSAVDWFRNPALGPGLITAGAFAIAIGITELIAGLRRRGVLYATLAMALIASVGQFPLRPFLESRTWATWGTLFLLALVTVGVGIGVGMAFGGLDRGQAARAAVFTGLFSGALIVLDVVLRTVPSYSSLVRGRMFATVGSNTPNFEGNFWQRFLDNGLHLVLPTLAIMLISFAQYSRYSRASMLETMNQDYVRTARAKGLTERTVVVRHAFRNAMIPLATLAALDFGAIISGAIITEHVFGWQGMGRLFTDGLIYTNPNQVMGFYLVTAVSIVVFNLLADIAYAYLDPRIRLS